MPGRIVEIDHVAGRNLAEVVQRQVIVADVELHPGDELANAQPGGRRPDFPDQRPRVGPTDAVAAPRKSASRRRPPCPAARPSDNGTAGSIPRRSGRRYSEPRKYRPASLKMNSSPSRSTKSTPSRRRFSGQLVAQFHEDRHAAGVVVGPDESAPRVLADLRIGNGSVS